MSFTYEYKWSYYPIVTQRDITPSDSVSGNFTITIYPYWFKQITLEWRVPSDWGSCHFNVYKAETESGPFKRLNPTPLTPGTNFFKDSLTQDYSKVQRGWYVLEAVLASGKKIQSKSITWENKRYPWVELRAQEIQRREWLLLTKFVGVDSYMLRRKTYGQRCSNCWNFELEKITKDKCTVCMGTSFEGGYFEAVRTRIQYDPNPDDVRLTYFGKWEDNQLFAWTIAFPEVHAQDLIYRPSDGAIFEVANRKATELQTVAVRQLLQLTMLDKESPEYNIVVKYDLIPEPYQS